MRTDREKESSRWTWIVGCLLIAAISACAAVLLGSGGLRWIFTRSWRLPAVNEPEQTSTWMATSVSEQLPAQMATKVPEMVPTGAGADLDEARNWPLVFSEPFDSNENRWSAGDLISDFGTFQREVNWGVYWLLGVIETPFTLWSVPESELWTDFYATIEAGWVGGSQNVEYGIVFRYQNDRDFYLFEIVEHGYYSVGMSKGGKWQVLVDWTQTDAIREGDINHLSVIGVGSEFSFFINDVFVDEYEEDSFSLGRIGVIAGFGEQDVSAELFFDNLEVRAP